MREPSLIRTEREKSVDEILHNRLQVDAEKLISICKQFDIIKLGLFGSALRDDFRTSGENPSDVDLLIEFEPKRRVTWQFWLELQTSFEGLFQRKVDLVRKHLLTNPYRRAEILSTHCVIYEQQ